MSQVRIQLLLLGRQNPESCQGKISAEICLD